MSPDQALVDFVKASVAIGAVIGDRFFPQLIPDPDTIMPCATFKRRVTPLEITHTGPSGAQHLDFEIVIWDQDTNKLIAGQFAFKFDLHGRRGPMGDDPQTVTFFRSEAEGDNAEVELQNRTLVLRMFYKES